MIVVFMWFEICFFKQKTAYEMRISDWSSDVCSSELLNCTGPRTCPAFTPVDMTAPKVRMSQKLAHIQAVSSRALASSLGSLLYSSALATGGMTASQASDRKSVV